MRVKERDKHFFSGKIRRLAGSLYAKIWGRKAKILILVLLACFFFLAGMFFTVITSGSAGNSDKSTVRELLNWMNQNGFHGIFEHLVALKEKLNQIKAENIKIPLNYLRGQFSNPEKLFIDIDFLDFKKIEYKREQALDTLHYKGPFQSNGGVLLTSADDFVPAVLSYNGKSVEAKLRLKGDVTDHLEGEKWSYRIKVKGDETIDGMNTFSIQDSLLKAGVEQFLYQELLKREELVALRYNFIDIIINGERKGIYALEEHFEKQLIENNGRREGILFKFETDFVQKEIIQAADQLDTRRDYFNFTNQNSQDWFYNSNIDTFDNDAALADPVLSKQFTEARTLLELFRKNTLRTSEVFDTKKLATYFAINTLMGDTHSSAFTNIRFYYNPLTSRIEPIGYDLWKIHDASEALELFFPECVWTGSDKGCPTKTGRFRDLVFRDPVFFEEYVKELERVSKKEYLDAILPEIEPDLKRNIDIIHKDNPAYHFSTKQLYENQKLIQRKLEHLREINAYLESDFQDDLQNSILSQRTITLAIGNTQPLPIEVVRITYNTSFGKESFELKGEDKYVQPKPKDSLVEYKKFEFAVPSDFPVGPELSDSLAQEVLNGLKLEYKVPGGTKSYLVAVLPWPYPEDASVKDDFIRKEPTVFSKTFAKMLDIDTDKAVITIQKGTWILQESLVIPPGFTVLAEEGTSLDLRNGAVLLSYSPVEFIGTEETPIIVTSSDSTGQGIAVIKSGNTPSILKHVIISNLNNPSKPGWELTGAVSFYESPLRFENVIIQHMKAEDAVNIINSDYQLKNVEVMDTSSDCLDVDFSKGMIVDSSFLDCGGDGVDFSGSVALVARVVIAGSGDKGISVGEKSKVAVEDSKIDRSYIAFASKDLSTLLINTAIVSNSEYGFAAYRKKAEFGPASIIAASVEMNNLQNHHLIEIGSSVTVNEIDISEKEKQNDVYVQLYGES